MNKILVDIFFINNKEVRVYANVDNSVKSFIVSNLHKELDCVKNSLKITQYKLNNISFLEKAPKNIIELELQKEKDFITRFRSINIIINTLNS